MLCTAQYNTEMDSHILFYFILLYGHDVRNFSYTLYINIWVSSVGRCLLLSCIQNGFIKGLWNGQIFKSNRVVKQTFNWINWLAGRLCYLFRHFGCFVCSFYKFTSGNYLMCEKFEQFAKPKKKRFFDKSWIQHIWSTCPMHTNIMSIWPYSNHTTHYAHLYLILIGYSLIVIDKFHWLLDRSGEGGGGASINHY